MRFLQRPPLHRHRPPASRFQIRRPGEEVANLLRGAVRAVSHDFDGFVRRRLCGLVASHYRPWGSPGFVPTDDVTAAHPTLLTGAVPFEAFPFWRSGHRHRAIAGAFTGCPAPLVVGPLSSRESTEAVPPSESRPHLRGVLARSPLRLTRCCHHACARCSLGLLSDSRLSPVELIGDDA